MSGNLLPLRGDSLWGIYLILSAWTLADFFTSVCPDPPCFVVNFQNSQGRVCAIRTGSMLQDEHSGCFTCPFTHKNETKQGKSFTSFPFQNPGKAGFYFPWPKDSMFERSWTEYLCSYLSAVTLHIDSTRHLLLPPNRPKAHLNQWESFYEL